MSASPETSPDLPERSALVLLGAMAGGLVILGVVLPLVGAKPVAPEPWMLLAVVAATVLSWAAVLVSPVPRPKDDGPVRAPELLPVMLVRVVLLEAPALVGVALAFLSTPFNLTVYLLPAIFALGGMWLFARPAVIRARMERARRLSEPRTTR